MKHLIVIISLLVASCGYNINCSYSFWAAGMVFCYEMPFDDPPNTQMIEELVTDIENVSRTYYPNVYDLRSTLMNRNTTIYVIEGDIRGCTEAPSSPHYICYKNLSGYNSAEDGLIVIEHPHPNTCLIRSVLMHEILHTVDYEYMGGSAHDTPFLFIQNYNTIRDIRNTIEWKLNQLLDSKVENYIDNCE